MEKTSTIQLDKALKDLQSAVKIIQVDEFCRWTKSDEKDFDRLHCPSMGRKSIEKKLKLFNMLMEKSRDVTLV